ncbi:MAG TPA: glycosyltransferase family 4 protein [Coleofasciculaceae cyanobacterium]|jgi:glycosyltransferase involved in cell wall biosynthesis
MKITFVMASGFALTGGDRVVATYAECLHKQGHEVLVVSRPRRGISLRERARALMKGQLWLSDDSKSPSHFDNLDVPCRLTDHFGPVTNDDLPDADVVIATWWETAEWVANLSPSKGAKAYFIQHHENFDYLPKKQVEASYRLPLHKITIAQWLVDLMGTLYDDHHVSLVPNSVDTKQFYASPRGRQQVPTVGLTYSGIPWKGCDIALEAFSIAAQQIPNLRLLSFGSSHPKPDLPLPVGTEFLFSPSQEVIRQIYSRCDAWLFSSRIEGYGLPILEAMACRTPVIGTPAGAAPELLSNGAGLLVNPEDPVDMAKAIVKIYQLSEDQWKAMSDMAYAKVTGYPMEAATKLFESALQIAIERSQQGAICK